MSQWLDKARDTHQFHIEHLRENDRWRISDTAKFLKRSLGGVCEDLLIIKWLKTHKEEIETFKYASKALEFIREKEKEAKIEEVE